MISEEKPTTNFNLWLQAVEPETLEVHALYQAVEEVTNQGPFTCSPGRDAESDEHQVTTSILAQPLKLGSEKARKAFLAHLRHEYMNGMDADIWLSLQKEKEAK